ncbi:MAG: hypothetical protein JRJ24_02465 [Deltaproteobacteria bacterium]|nr:hypothetical protein [Deltaproteobacteria bacterium]
MSDPIRLGIFGWPVAHSKSPRMHESAANALGISLRYERFEVAPGDLADAVRRKHEAGIDGYNLTVPHKEAIIALIDEVAPAAQAIGAVNTVVRTDGRYVGHNTDAPGLVRSLEEGGRRARGSRWACECGGQRDHGAFPKARARRSAHRIVECARRVRSRCGSAQRGELVFRNRNFVRSSDERHARIEPGSAGVRRVASNRCASGGRGCRRYGLQTAQDIGARARRGAWSHHR